MDSRITSYENLSDWLSVMRGHACEDKAFIPSDNPLEGLVGYRCSVCGDIFYIPRGIVQDNTLFHADYFVDGESRNLLTKELSRRQPPKYVTLPDDPEDIPVTVLVLKGNQVLYNRTHKSVDISQTRTVTPVYGGYGYQNWGQPTDMHVELGSERTVITLK